jgi:hypothetical protein
MKQLKSKIKCKGRYKGLIDGKVQDLFKNDEFLCEPELAIRLINHYPDTFEVIGSEDLHPETTKSHEQDHESEEKPETELNKKPKRFKSKNKLLGEYKVK